MLLKSCLKPIHNQPRNNMRTLLFFPTFGFFASRPRCNTRRLEEKNEKVSFFTLCSYIFELVLDIPFKFALSLCFLAAKLIKLPLQTKSSCKTHLDFNWGLAQRGN